MLTEKLLDLLALKQVDICQLKWQIQELVGAYLDLEDKYKERKKAELVAGYEPYTIFELRKQLQEEKEQVASANWRFNSLLKSAQDWGAKFYKEVEKHDKTKMKLEDAERFIGDVQLGCDITRAGRLYRQVPVVIGPGLTTTEVKLRDAKIELEAAQAKIEELEEEYAIATGTFDCGEFNSDHPKGPTATHADEAVSASEPTPRNHEVHNVQTSQEDSKDFFQAGSRLVGKVRATKQTPGKVRRQTSYDGTGGGYGTDSPPAKSEEEVIADLVRLGNDLRDAGSLQEEYDAGNRWDDYLMKEGL